ncbi:hypothetical protein Tco_0664716 [Tanacetum coccineum]
MKAICNLDVPMDSKAPKPSSQTEEVPQGKNPGAKSGLRRKKSSKHTSKSKTEASKSKTGQSEKETQSSSAKDKSPSHPSAPIPVVGEMHMEAQQAAGGPTSLGATSEEGAHPQLSSGHDALIDSTTEADPGNSTPNDSIPSQQDQTKSARDGLKTAHTDSDESEEEEEVDKDKDTHATSHDVPEDTSIPHPPSPKLAQIQELMAQARPSYPDINQLTDLLVTSLKPEFSKILASHDFASCLPIKLKEIPSKFTELSGEIKELKKHVKDMEIELLGDLKNILTKQETFTSTISNLTSQVAELKNIKWELPAEFLDLPSQVSSVQEKLKAFDSLPSLLNKVTDPLNRFATMVEHASRATTKVVLSAGQATAPPAEGEKNTNPATTDAELNLYDELVDLLGIDVVTQYYNKKLLYDKYCDKMLKRRKSSKITNYDVLTQKGPISLKVVQACPDRKEKGWKTIYGLIKTRMEYLDQTEKELKIDFNKPLNEQDPLNELNDLANKKRKRTGDSTNHSRSSKKHKSSVQHEEEVH